MWSAPVVCCGSNNAVLGCASTLSCVSPIVGLQPIEHVVALVATVKLEHGSFAIRGEVVAGDVDANDWSHGVQYVKPAAPAPPTPTTASSSGVSAGVRSPRLRGVKRTRSASVGSVASDSGGRDTGSGGRPRSGTKRSRMEGVVSPTMSGRRGPGPSAKSPSLLALDVRPSHGSLSSTRMPALAVPIEQALTSYRRVCCEYQGKLLAWLQASRGERSTAQVITLARRLLLLPSSGGSGKRVDAAALVGATLRDSMATAFSCVPATSRFGGCMNAHR